MNTAVTRSRLTEALWITALGACLCATQAAAASSASDEEPFYKLLTIPVPEGIVLEAGAIQTLPDRRIAVSTRFGDIYVISGAYDDPPNKPKFHLFASGLHEVLGLSLRKRALYAIQRGELTRLIDLNRDDRADRIETVSDAWGINGDYHEYAFGSKFDKQGYTWIVLCLTGSFTSESPYRGTQGAL